MTLATSYRPVARTEHLDRLAVLLPISPDTTEQLWSAVDGVVQAQLAILETEVRRQLAGVRVTSGRTQGDRFFLFSYRTFSMPQSGLDPVVVGVTFTPAHLGVTVEADVSGEQTGDIILSAPSKEVAHSREKLLATARDSAESVCQSAEAIAGALNDPSRKVE
jgi:hypothetical protein